MESPRACSCGCPPDSIFYGMCVFTDCPYWIKDHGGATPPTSSNESEPHLPTNEIPECPRPARFQFSDEAQMKELAEGVQPINTTNSTKWALKTFEQWRSERNSQPGIDSVPFLVKTLLNSVSIYHCLW